MVNLTSYGQELAAKAAESNAGRAAHTVVHGNRFRQVQMALKAGGALADHENPGEASLQCLSGRVMLTAGEESWELVAGDVILIPQHRHRVDAHEDSVILLSVVLRG